MLQLMSFAKTLLQTAILSQPLEADFTGLKLEARAGSKAWLSSLSLAMNLLEAGRTLNMFKVRTVDCAALLQAARARSGHEILQILVFCTHTQHNLPLNEHCSITE